MNEEKEVVQTKEPSMVTRLRLALFATLFWMGIAVLAAQIIDDVYTPLYAIPAAWLAHRLVGMRSKDVGRISVVAVTIALMLAWGFLWVFFWYHPAGIVYMFPVGFAFVFIATKIPPRRKSAKK
jgi:hypothetical protein